MEVVEVNCSNCGKPIYVLEGSVRNEMFCTLGCMELYKKNKEVINPLRDLEQTYQQIK